MRVSGFQKYQMTQNYLNQLQYDQTKKHEQISTGKTFSRVSDDPVRVNRSMLLDSSLSRIDQYLVNGSDAKGLLEFVDTTYGNAIDAIHQVKETAIKGSNGTTSAEDKKVMALEIEQMIKQVVSLANSRYMDRYSFSGEKTSTEPITYDGNTFTYNGNDKDMKIQVSDDLKLNVSQQADDVFIPILEDMVKVRDALNANDPDALRAGMTLLDSSYATLVNKRSETGVQLKSIEILAQSFQESKVDLTAKKQETDDINLADAISEFAYMETLYQATIRSASVMLKTSIMDYI